MTNIRVLVAEDDYFVGEEIVRILKKNNYEVLEIAIDGVQAVKLCCILKPDIVLMDIKMPKKTGIEAAKEIQQTCPTPTVILTAHETPELLEKACEFGALAYLVKPPKAPEIIRAITVSIARHKDLVKLQNKNKELEIETKERKRNEEILTRSRKTYRELTETMKDVVAKISASGKILYISPSLLEFGGYNPKEEIGSHISKFFEDKFEVINALELLEKVLNNYKSHHFEFLFKPKNNSPFPVKISYNPILKNKKAFTVQIILRKINQT